MFTLFIILLFGVQVTDQPQFKRYDTSSGLSNNIIHDVFQDAEGYLWIATENGLNRFDGHSFTVFKHSPEDSSTISHSVVMDILEDTPGNLWLGTWDGFNRFDRINETFEHFEQLPQSEDYRIHGNQNIITPSGEIAFLCEKTICFLDPETGIFSKLNTSDNSQSLLPESFGNKIFVDDQSRLWLYNESDNFLGKIDPETKRITATTFPESTKTIFSTTSGRIFSESANKSLSQFQISKMPSVPVGVEPQAFLEDRDGGLLLGTDLGVFYASAGSEEFKNISGDKFGSGSLSYFVEQIYEDRWGGIWIGTRNGLFHYDPLKKPFFHLDVPTSGANPESNNSTLVMSIEKTDQTMWIGTLGSGIIRYDLGSGQFQQIDVHSATKPESNQVWDVFYHSGNSENLWIATTAGLYTLNTESLESTHIPLSYDPPSTPVAFTIIEADEHSIWVAGNYDVYRIDIKSQQVIQRIPFDPELDVSTVQSLHRWNDDLLLIGTQGAGLFAIDTETGNFISIFEDNEDENKSGNFPIWDIFEDQSGTIWLATGSGLYSIDPESTRLTHHPESQRSGASVFYSIAEDDIGNLWLGSDNSLAKYEISTQTFRYFDESFGVENPEFNRRAFLSDESGMFWFGGINGITYFHPEEIKVNPHPPLPKITDVILFDEKGSTGIQSDPTIPVEFSWQENTMELGFTGINFSYPEKTTFEYRLSDVDPNWISTDNQKFARYTKLPPGDYSFQVRASNSDGVMSPVPATFNFTIHPPFWKTTAAYLLYLIILGSGIFLFIRYRTRSLEKERKKLEEMVSERTEELESQKELALQAKKKIEIQAGQLKELDEMKSQFFANISHELRTPLTLIDAPLQQLIEENLDDYPPEKLQRKLIGAQRNSNRLKKLIDELLDLSRLKEKTIEVKRSPLNIKNWFKLFLDSYHSMALSRGINFRSSRTIEGSEYLMIDVEKLDKITSNLMNNALKFTGKDDFIEISLTSSSQELKFEIRDSGMGIKEEDVPRIFDRFYKGDNQSDYETGLGLGLALSQELAQVMGGKITVSSTFGDGSSFALILPVTEVKKASEPKEPNQIQKPKLTSSSSIALIVEDNSEMRKFLVQLLETNFEVHTASNGKEALQKLKVIQPNVIITDLMMPEMDGLELTHFLRKTPHFAHIPILMLTARSSEDDRIHGLRLGVDDYLSKPFLPEEVKVRALNLANHHKNRSAEFSNEENMAQETDTELQDIQKIVQDHFDDSSFNVTALAGYLHTSERQIYRTMQRLTGMTPLEYINSIRLDKARNLLIKDKELTIDLVAKKVGFKSRSYFSKLFKKAYGLSPGRYQSQK